MLSRQNGWSSVFNRIDGSAIPAYGVSLMFVAVCPEMLVRMTGTERRADTPPVNWSELVVGELPTGTVTLLLADIEGSTRLWETEPEEMTAAGALFERVLRALLRASRQ